MAEQNLFCLCGRCSRKLRSAAARRVGMGSTCCRKETGKTIAQLLKELDEQEAAAAAEQQEPDAPFPRTSKGKSRAFSVQRRRRLQPSSTSSPPKEDRNGKELCM